MTRLVMVGGGHAHLAVLRALAQQRPPGVEVILITPCAHQNYSGMLPGWIAGHYAAADCRIALRPLVQAAGARLILDQIVALDASRRCVGLADGRQLVYDLLSLDVGSETDTSWLQTLGSKLLPDTRLRPGGRGRLRENGSGAGKTGSTDASSAASPKQPPGKMPQPQRKHDDMVQTTGQLD